MLPAFGAEEMIHIICASEIGCYSFTVLELPFVTAEPLLYDGINQSFHLYLLSLKATIPQA